MAFTHSEITTPAVWAESLSGGPDYGPYPDEVTASLAMDDLGLADNSYKLVTREPGQNRRTRS